MSEADQRILEKFRGKVLKEFMPAFLLAQHASEPTLEYEDFDECVDEYFSQAEKYKARTKTESQEAGIWSKMRRIQADQEKRISGLQREQDLSELSLIHI